MGFCEKWRVGEDLKGGEGFGFDFGGLENKVRGQGRRQYTGDEFILNNSRYRNNKRAKS